MHTVVLEALINSVTSEIFVMLWLLAMGYSHLAGKKYWIISRVVEVITSQSNEIYHEWPKATSDKFITLTSDYLNHE